MIQHLYVKQNVTAIIAVQSDNLIYTFIHVDLSSSILFIALQWKG